MNVAKRYRYILNIVTGDRQTFISPVTDKNKPVLRMISSDTPDNLIGEPSYPVAGNPLQRSRIDRNNHLGTINRIQMCK